MVTKEELRNYIGDVNSLGGYSRSYKLVLYKILFQDLYERKKSYIYDVAKKFKDFYFQRKQQGKIADKDVDDRITYIEDSSLDQVLVVIKNNPYKHIHENGFLNVYKDNLGLFFSFSKEIVTSLTKNEISELIRIVDVKTALYFSRIDQKQLIVESKKVNDQVNVDIFDLQEVDYCNLDKYKKLRACPALLFFGKTFIRINSGEEFVKIFYYSLYKTELGKKLIDDYIQSDGKLIVTNNRVFRDSIKFTPELYVKRVDNDPFALLKKLDPTIFNNGDFKVWVKNIDADPILIQEKEDQIIDEYCQRHAKRSKVEKKSKYLLAHINGECLSDEEKFFIRLEKEYDRKILLGDITISEEEEVILNEYMSRELNALNNNLGSNFIPQYKKVFGYGLVKYAMKYYSQGVFWPYFSDEYGVDLKPVAQGIIHDVFKSIMQSTGKTYDVNSKQKIDNISLHCFVTDKCADRFFDFLFDFWRLDLSRNIENMYGDSGNENFKVLLNEIKGLNNRFAADVMKHTTMAVLLNEKSCKLRIRRILKIIDDCFWNQTEIPRTGNRFNELLRNWMSTPNGSFQKEYSVTIRRRGGSRGESLLSKPLIMSHNGRFAIKLPREILHQCTEDEHPIWHITAIDCDEIAKEPGLLKGKVGLYTEEESVSIPSNMLFKRISMRLISEHKTYAKFVYDSDSVRFFNNNGKLIDYENSLPVGKIFCYCVDENVPQVLYNELVKPVRVSDGIYFAEYEVEKGNIIYLHNEHAVQVGGRIVDGLNGGLCLDGVKAIYGDGKINIYSKLPRILFKANKTKISGTMVSVFNGVKRECCKLTEAKYYEFKIDDVLDEVYAYLIDLNDFINVLGCYQIEINIPGGRSQYVFNICYVPEFSYEFENAPYIFTGSGSVRFNSNADFILNDDGAWECDSSAKRLSLNFDPNCEDFSKYIKDWKLHLKYNVAGVPLKLEFDIPILLWKFKKADDWAYNIPSEIFVKNIPDNLYLTGPFDFKDKSKNKVYFGSRFEFNEDTDLFAETVKETNYYVFRFANIKSWINREQLKRQVYLLLNGLEYKFVDIVCRSEIKEHSITGDFDKNIIYGQFEIYGENEFVVTIKHGNDIIIQDLPLEDGKFEYETELMSGTYRVIVFEIEESDDGFDSFTYKLGSYDLHLANISDLRGAMIKLVTAQDYEKRYSKLLFSRKYYIGDLQKTSFDEIESLGIEVLRIWNLDISDDMVRDNAIVYNGKLGYYDQSGIFIDECDVIVVFEDKLSLNNVIILRNIDGEASELIYDEKYRVLLKNDDGIDIKLRKQYVKLLADDKYDLFVEICGVDDVKEKSSPLKSTLLDDSITKRRFGSVDTPIDRLNLSIRCSSALRRANYLYIEQIEGMSDDALLKIRNFNYRCVSEVRDKIKRYRGGK